MKAIHNKVNIVPVIAKADTLTLKERERLKKRVSVSREWGARDAGCGRGVPWGFLSSTWYLWLFSILSSQSGVQLLLSFMIRLR